MPNTQNELSYSGRSVLDIRRELIELIPRLTDKWTDFNESDLGITLIELIASVQDMQNFYFDTQAFETYLDTAVQDKNLRSLMRAMNYRVPLVNSAKGEVTIYFDSNTNRNIFIPRYTRVYSTKPSVRQQYCVADTIEESGTFSEITIPIIEGEVKSLFMTRNDFLRNKNTNGKVSRRVYLGYKTVSDRSVAILQNGVIWEEVDDALLKYEGGYYYSVHKDSDGNVYVLMPVNFLDLLPLDANESITFRFLISLGVDGTVEAGDLDAIDMNIAGMVSLTNESATVGGANEPDLQTHKILARKNAVTMDRYITLEDYRTGVFKNSAVYDCVVKDWKYKKYVNFPYLVKIWAVDFSGRNLDSETKKEIKMDLMKKGNVEVDIEFPTVPIVEFWITAKIVLNVTKRDELVRVRQAVESNVITQFSRDNLGFGRGMSLNYVYSLIKSTSPMIIDVEVTSLRRDSSGRQIIPAADITVDEIAFSYLKNVSISVVDSLSTSGKVIDL